MFVIKRDTDTQKNDKGNVMKQKKENDENKQKHN